MARVTGQAAFGIEERFGRVPDSGYIYFLHPTIAQVWCREKPLRDKITSWLGARADGKLLDAQQRAHLGVGHERFGDALFVLNEGLVFQPNFVEHTMPRVTEGYLPAVASQHAFFGYRGPLAQQSLQLDSVTDIFPALRIILDWQER